MAGNLSEKKGISLGEKPEGQEAEAATTEQKDSTE